MNKKISTQALVIASLCVVINIIGGYLVTMVKIPLLFLDAIGTIFSAVILGPWVGGLVGVVTNLVLGIIQGPTAIPFGIVSLAIGVIVGFIAKKRNFSLGTAIITGLIISVVAPLIGTPIAVAIFGGLTGGGTDIFVIWLLKSGQKIFTAAFLPRITGNLVDKIGSCIIVYYLVKALPMELMKGKNSCEA
ncbi:MAG: ECF transporter S component [Halanaerobiales bacterium]|nr:ECF transporter S component [Halanaerobiales bacterium]